VRHEYGRDAQSKYEDGEYVCLNADHLGARTMHTVCLSDELFFVLGCRFLTGFSFSNPDGKNGAMHKGYFSTPMMRITFSSLLLPSQQFSPQAEVPNFSVY
jgi:hypothetical protein